MTTIDNLDISVYNLYAMRTRMIEQINLELRIDRDASIPPQTTVVDIVPKISELDLLLGIVPMHTPWAYFYPPKKFRSLRRSPFTFFRVAPAFGGTDEEEEEEKLAHVTTNSKDEEEEKEILHNCLKKIDWLNQMMSFIVGRVGQFLQG